MKRYALLALLLIAPYAFAGGGVVSGGTGTQAAAGGGTTNTIPKWTGAFSLGDSLLSDDGTNVTQASGQFLAPNGTTAAPSYSFSGDTNLGFSLNSTGSVSYNDASVERFRLLTSGGTLRWLLESATTLEWGSSGVGSPDVILSRAAANVLQLASGDSFRLAGGKLQSTPQAATCADSGDGNPGALTLTPTATYVEITNSDANGCTVTMGEGSAVVGELIVIAVVSNAGGTVDFADTAGVSELAGAFNAAIDDTITLVYGNTTTYREITRSNN